MKKFSTYLVVMFMIVFWILRIVITLSAEMGSNFLGITPINETFEIVILFATLVCAILIVKRKLVGSLLYLAIHAVYFGGDVTDKLNIMANNGQLTVAQSTDFIFSVIGIILPLAVLLDLLLDKNSEVGHLNIGAGRTVYQSLTLINKAVEDGSFYKNEEFDRKLDDRADKNNYRTM